MTALLRRIFLTALSGWLLSPAPAQTAVWIGQGNLTTSGDWNTPGNWDTGAVPNSASGIAIINQVTPVVRNVPDGPYANTGNPALPAMTGGALAVITGPVTLGSLRLDLPTANSSSTGAVYIGQPGPGVTGSLRLEGAGLDVRTQSFVNADVNVTSGSSLTLASSARFTRTGPAPVNLYLSETTAAPATPARLLLRDDAGLENAATRWLTILGRGAADIVFQDRARAGSTTFRFANDVTTSFHNAASAETAAFNLGANNLLLFDDSSTAAFSSILFAGSPLVPGNSTVVRFAGQSSAAQSSISSITATNNTVEFADQAVAGTAQIYLENGMTVHFTNTASADHAVIAADNGRVLFNDSTTAGSARIATGGLGSIVFADASGTGQSEIKVSQGDSLTFTGGARADGGTNIFAAGPGYWATPAPGFSRGPYSSVTFQDSAQLNGALIESGGEIVFRDNTLADSGVLRVHHTALFQDNASAGHALFQNTDGLVTFTDHATASTAFLNAATVEFRGSATAGGAWIRADTLRFMDQSTGGTMLVFNSNRIEVLGQADLATASLVTAPLLDISGAAAPGGSSARTPARGTAAGGMVADNSREVRVNNLYNFSGNVYLGSNTLVLGSSQTAYVDGRITDAGGAYRSGDNRDYVGGGLVIDAGVGSARRKVRISNPNNDYSGPTVIRAGMLSLEGGALSATTINVDALLYGFGTVKGNLANNGTLNTDIQGFGLGRTFNVQGDYIHGLTGNLQMRMAADNRNTLNVGGTAILQGGILTFFGGTPFSQGETINFLNAAARTGEWAAISLPGVAAGFAARVNYTATGAQLVIENFSGLHGASAAATLAPAQLIVLTPMGYRGDSTVRRMFGLSEAAPVETLVQAVAAHDPTVYGVLPAGSFLSALSLQQGAERQQHPGGALLPEHRLVFTSEVSQRREGLDSLGGLPATQARAGGFTASGLWRSGDFLLAGTLAYENSRAEPATGGVFTLDRVSPGLALRFERDDSFVSLSTAYTYEDYDLTRPISFAGTGLLARSAPRAGRFDATLLAGHLFRLGDWTLTPAAGLMGSSWRMGGFTEGGVPAGAAIVSDWRNHSLYTRAGFELAAAFADHRLTPRLSVLWLHEVDSGHTFGVRFDGAPDGFTLPGRPADPDYLQASLGCDWRMSDRLTASLDLGGMQSRSSAVTAAFSGGLRWEF